MADRLQLWGGGTSRTLRAHWMLQELELPYDAHLIGPRTGETRTDSFRRLNPKEKIPVLVDGAFVLTESVAIVTWLGDHHGRGTGLVPEPRTVERGRYDEWMSFLQMELDAHTLYVIRKHRDLASLYGAAPTAIEAAVAGFLKQVTVVDTALGRHPFILGERFSAVDIVLTSVLDWARAYGIDLSAVLEDYRLRMAARPACRAASRLNFSIPATPTST